MTTPDNLDPSTVVLYKGHRFALEQTAEFEDWLTRLRDTQGKVRILKRLRRLADGAFGDCMPVGGAVHELRMFFGPGYRVYFMQRDNTVILLLAGGDKDNQVRDIALAKELARSEHDGIDDKTV